MGRKHDELVSTEREIEAILKARAVVQGSNVRTKSGASPFDIYEQVSNAPETFAAARCAIVATILRMLVVTFRDVEQAYLQARIDTPGRVKTLVESRGSGGPTVGLWMELPD